MPNMEKRWRASGNAEIRMGRWGSSPVTYLEFRKGPPNYSKIQTVH